MKKTIIFFTFLAVTSCANSIPSNQDDILAELKARGKVILVEYQPDWMKITDFYQ